VIQRKKRHPIMGLFFGLLLGLGLGLMAIIYGIYFAGPMTPWLLVGLGVVIGLVMSFVPRPWGRKPPPAGAR
jgi:drug/metabolite transporter (DMT)-like permease